MKKTVISIVTLCALFIAGVARAEEIDETLDAPRDARISVSNLAGEVEVSAWKESRVEVTGTLGDDVEEFVFERNGKQVTIKVKVPDRSWGKKDVTSRLNIRVPEASSLSITTVSAEIDVEGVNGEQRLQTVSGDITTEAFTAEIDAESVSGDVDIKGTGKAGEWRLSSVSGDINGRNLAGEINAEVVSGDIEVTGGAFDRMIVETVNGDIDFKGGLRDEGRIDIETVNGDVDIELTGKVSAKFDIDTFNGDIRNCFGPKAERTSRHAPGWELSFTEGSGEGRVTISTLNGDLNLCKE